MARLSEEFFVRDDGWGRGIVVGEDGSFDVWGSMGWACLVWVTVEELLQLKVSLVY